MRHPALRVPIEAEYEKRLQIARETFSNHLAQRTLERTEQGYKKMAGQQGSLLENNTHVLLVPKLGHFIDRVNIKHYCNLSGISDYMKFISLSVNSSNSVFCLKKKSTYSCFVRDISTE